MSLTADKLDGLPTTDLGPTVPPPAWCLPGTQPHWDVIGSGRSVGVLCTWTRHFPEPQDPASALCWITAEDRIAGGRVIRTAPWISTDEHEVSTGEDARKLAAALLNAADVLEGVTD
ncbi:hypothetical protein [Mycolicibacterium sp. XJ870]